MTKEWDDVLVFQLPESISEFSFSDRLFLGSPFIWLWLHKVEQVVVEDSTLLDSFLVVLVYFLDNLDNLFDSVRWSAWHSSGDDVHIDFPSHWVSSTLLHSCSDESDCFLDISLFNSRAESHLCDGFRNSNHRFELSWRGSDSLLGVTETSHFGILLNQIVNYVIWDCWAHVLSGIRNIGCEEFSIDLVALNQFSGLSWGSRDWWGGVKRDNMVCKSPISSIVLSVQD